MMRVQSAEFIIANKETFKVVVLLLTVAATSNVSPKDTKDYHNIAYKK